MLKKLLFASLLLSSSVFAAQTVTLNLADLSGNKVSAGTITLTDTQYGLVLTPELYGLTPGKHGFHIHANPSCEPAKKGDTLVPALAAGGHYDPNKTGKHDYPWGNGHLGDLPVLYVDHHGMANEPVLAPRLMLADVKGHAIMVHAGGDNHSDMPKKLGGGGSRMACGVVE